MGIQLLRYSGYDLNHGKVWIFQLINGEWESIGWVWRWDVIQEHNLRCKSMKHLRQILPTIEVSNHMLERMAEMAETSF